MRRIPKTIPKCIMLIKFQQLSVTDKPLGTFHASIWSHSNAIRSKINLNPLSLNNQIISPFHPIHKKFILCNFHLVKLHILTQKNNLKLTFHSLTKALNVKHHLVIVLMFLWYWEIDQLYMEIMLWTMKWKTNWWTIMSTEHFSLKIINLIGFKMTVHLQSKK